MAGRLGWGGYVAGTTAQIPLQTLLRPLLFQPLDPRHPPLLMEQDVGIRHWALDPALAPSSFEIQGSLAAAPEGIVRHHPHLFGSFILESKSWAGRLAKPESGTTTLCKAEVGKEVSGI